MKHSYRIKNITDNTYLHNDNYWHQLGHVNISVSSFPTEQSAEEMLLIQSMTHMYYTIEKVYYRFI